jgi:hypothetical protein
MDTGRIASRVALRAALAETPARTAPVRTPTRRAVNPLKWLAPAIQICDSGGEGARSCETRWTVQRERVGLAKRVRHFLRRRPLRLLHQSQPQPKRGVRLHSGPAARRAGAVQPRASGSMIRPQAPPRRCASSMLEVLLAVLATTMVFPRNPRPGPIRRRGWRPVTRVVGSPKRARWTCHRAFNFWSTSCNVSCRSGYYACCSCGNGCDCVVDHDELWPLPPDPIPSPSPEPDSERWVRAGVIVFSSVAAGGAECRRPRRAGGGTPDGAAMPRPKIACVRPEGVPIAIDATGQAVLAKDARGRDALRTAG